MSLPVIDLGVLFGDNAKDRAAAAAQIGAACRADGFFYVTGHGGEGLFADLQDESERFFGLPLEERMAIAMANGGPACCCRAMTAAAGPAATSTRGHGNPGLESVMDVCTRRAGSLLRSGFSRRVRARRDQFLDR